MSTVQQHLAAGRLDEAIAATKDLVKREPSSTEHRRSLFGLFCVQADWERATSQLKIYHEMSNDIMSGAVYGDLIASEAERTAVFEGKKAPAILGQPKEWLAALTKALELVGQGKHDAASSLRAQAFEGAESKPGKVNGEPFQWIGDGDSRLGPVLEVIVRGSYQWLPLDQLRKAQFMPPADILDLVWAQAEFEFADGGVAVGFVPVRYPECPTVDHLLARTTSWRAASEHYDFGEGQREFSTDSGDYAILDVRSLELEL